MIREELVKAENLFPHTNDYLYDLRDYIDKLTVSFAAWLRQNEDNDYEAIFSVYGLLFEASDTVQEWIKTIDSYAEEMASIIQDAYKEVE